MLCVCVCGGGRFSEHTKYIGTHRTPLPAGLRFPKFLHQMHHRYPEDLRSRIKVF